MKKSDVPITKLDFMPRLIGKTSKAPLYFVMALLVATAAAAELEYSGAIDVVPDFGIDNQDARLPDMQNPRLRRPITP
jgi:hypothetical protein